MYREVTLGAWPYVGHVNIEGHGPDGNDTPPTAQDLLLSASAASRTVTATVGPSAEPLGNAGQGPIEFDWWDFYRVVNDTGVTRTITVSVNVKPTATHGTDLVVRHWVESPLASPLASPDYEDYRLSETTPVTFHATLAPGETKLLMMEVLTTFSTYTLQVSTP